MITTVIFDFDGLILDSEVVVYRSWQEIYQEYGCTLPLEKWLLRIGGSEDIFDAHCYLESLIKQPLSRPDLTRKRIARQFVLLSTYDALPGVRQMLTQATELELKIGLASSSDRTWVEGHLKRLELYKQFDSILCYEDVLHTKPHPEPYLSVLKALGVPAHQAIAFEDSPNGVRAAKDAGIFCVAVPNALTRQLSLDHADMQLPSLAEMPLNELLHLVESARA